MLRTTHEHYKESRRWWITNAAWWIKHHNQSIDDFSTDEAAIVNGFIADSFRYAQDYNNKLRR